MKATTSYPSSCDGVSERVALQIFKTAVTTYKKVLEDAACVETARVGEADLLCSHDL
jgi:hypothetical protein